MFDQTRGIVSLRPLEVRHWGFWTNASYVGDVPRVPVASTERAFARLELQLSHTERPCPRVT
ncbi:hypothetical protein M404DRAFT_999776 [Pisolithus tinctorius Marx 270]|uniref:Uncharacterized protein n=1 Tax=Pisolithus tinctorius Marx 270 TaxID=870435 RepID=A0A0C3NXV7_PISTI|nr:hypothetical protein M404DRAFT_999776 [Pisolithus tinctorius Marx 270]